MFKYMLCLGSVFLVLLLLFGCSTSKNISQQNIAYIYKKEANILQPSFIIHHLNDTISELHFKINAKALLYSKQANEEHFSTQVKVSYKLYQSYESQQMLDSSSIILTDNAYDHDAKDLIGKIEFKAATGNDFLMEVAMLDLNRGKSNKSFLVVEKNNINNRQNFIVEAPATRLPLFRNYIKENEEVTITYNQPAISKLYVRYYNRNFSIAAPPFVISNNKPFDYIADSLFEITLENNSSKISLKQKGFYHIQADSSLNKEGLTLFRFDNNNFPELESTDDLISPLRYITGKEEYDEMAFSNNKKEALDNFWIRNAGNPDRAKELIKKYYNRVQEANIFFTSYIEGWKTDRGMIYIIFGPPNVMYKTGNSESWIYGEERNLMSLNFTFYKVTNPFTDNDFSLDRSAIYKSNWYRAVDTWRQGRIF